MNISWAIENDLVFGRIHGERQISLHSLGRIRLVKDGTIRQYRHPNETRWRIRDDLVEFLHDRGHISTRFDSTIKIVDVEAIAGSCLVEPFRHFLYPYVALRDSGIRLLYLVTTTKLYGTALSQILVQLKGTGIAPESLWISVAQSDRADIERRDGVVFSHIRENAYEYIGLLDVLRRDVQFDHVLLLHDTVHVGQQFKRLVEDQPATIKFDYMSVQEWGQFNIGIYRIDFLRRNRQFLESLIGIPKQLAIDLEHNVGGMGLKGRAEITTTFLDCRAWETGDHTPYGSCVVRRGCYFPGADLHKFFYFSSGGFHPNQA